MKKYLLTIFCISFTFFYSNQFAQTHLTGLKGKYLGQKPPDNIPEIFAPGIISTNEFEHGTPVFNKDLTEFYLSRVMEHPTRFITYHYKMNSDETWISDTLFFDKYFNGEPSLSRDGKKLHYLSLKPTVFSSDSAKKIWKYWSLVKDGDRWTNPKLLPPPFASDKHEGQIFEASDGSFYFTSWRNGNQPDLFRIENKNGKNFIDTTFGKNINTKYEEKMAFVTDDGKFLLFMSNRPGGFGENDIYVSAKDKNNKWGEPINLGVKVNSSAREWYPRISPDGKYFFFLSNRTGNFDVYWMDAKDLFNELIFKEIK